MSRVGELSVDITADASRLRRELLTITGAGGPLAALPKVAAAAALAAGAAIAGIGAKGIAAFADFDKSMREVFTLLPGITQKAMDEMEAGVIAFSNEFGKLPSEVIPALYQALSAGVPQDNVFDFMRTATELSVGGVADLETAVDALTSIVNGYGREAITAEEASDMLFTAVKNGKTTVDELAGSVGRIVPIAADAGVGFDQVAAAIAAMTAQGLSTDEATTALRAMLTELTDGGSDVSERFAAITGTTFPEFIAAGGDLGGALALLRADTDSTGDRMTDVFGNIRGGLAATVLSGREGQSAFSSSLTEMGNSAGATREAFETMDAGISASWDRLTTRFNTLMIEVGDELAPMFQTAVDFIVSDVMPKLRDMVLGVFVAITTATEALTGVWNKYQTDSDGIFAAVRGIVEAAGAAIGAAFDLMVAAWETVLKPAWEAIEPLVAGVLGVVGTVVATAFGAITDILNALAALLRGDFTLAWEHLQSMMRRINDAVEEIVTAVWGSIKAFLEGVFGDIVTAATDRWEEAKAAIETSTTAVKTWLEDTWNSIKAWLENLWNDVAGIATTTWESIDANIRAPIQAAWDWLVATWEAIKTWVEGLWGDIATAATTQWESVDANIRAPVQAAGDWLTSTWNTIKQTTEGAWGDIAYLALAIWHNVKDNIMSPIAAAKTWLQDTFNAIKEWMGQNARDIATNAGINWAGVVSAIQGAFAGIADFVRGIFDGIVATITGAIDSVRGAAQSAMDFVNRVIGRANDAERAVADAAAALDEANANAGSGGSNTGGNRTWDGSTPDMSRDTGTGWDGGGTGYDVPAFASGGIVTSAMHAIVGEAGPEAIIPLDRLERIVGGGNQTIIVELDGRAIMRAIAPRMVNDLRLRTGIAP